MPLLRTPSSSTLVGVIGAAACLHNKSRVLAATTTASDASWAQDNCDILGLTSAVLDGSHICCHTDAETNMRVPFTLSDCRQACSTSWASRKCNAKGHICVSTRGSDKCCAPEHSDAHDATLGYAKCEPVRHSGFEGPHMDGLHGQSIDWSGEDGGWYALVQDKELGLYINVRVTTPLPEEFPHRQLVTGLSVLFGDHSFVVEASNPYTAGTSGCTLDISPCLASGVLTFAVDNDQPAALTGFLDGARLHNGVVLSATNVPLECGQFGGGSISATTREDTLLEERSLVGETFEEWVLKFRDMGAADWCAKYVTERGLADVQSTHTMLRIETPLATVRVTVGPNYRGSGENNWNGQTLSDLDVWQMGIGIEGLRIGDSLSGILGETSRPCLDKRGRVITSGPGALRGVVEDYRVSGPLGVELSLNTKLDHAL